MATGAFAWRRGPGIRPTSAILARAGRDREEFLAPAASSSDATGARFIWLSSEVEEAGTLATPTITPERPPDPAHPKGWIGLEVIAAFKFVQAALIFATGLGVMGLLDPAWAASTTRWLEQLALDAEHRLIGAWAAHALPYVNDAAPRRLVGIALGVIAYAIVILVEGIGLWRCRRWAEYLTIVVTASFLPVEMFAIWHRLTTIRVLVFVFNVLVIAFLVWQLRATRGRAAPAQRPARR